MMPDFTKAAVNYLDLIVYHLDCILALSCEPSIYLTSQEI